MVGRAICPKPVRLTDKGMSSMKMSFSTLDVSSYKDRAKMANFIADIADHYGFAGYVEYSDESKVVPLDRDMIVRIGGHRISFTTKITTDTYLFIGTWQAEAPLAFRWMPGAVVQKTPQSIMNTLATDFGSFAVLLDGALAAISRRENRFMGHPPILCDLIADGV